MLVSMYNCFKLLQYKQRWKLPSYLSGSNLGNKNIEKRWPGSTRARLINVKSSRYLKQHSKICLIWFMRRKQIVFSLFDLLPKWRFMTPSCEWNQFVKRRFFNIWWSKVLILIYGQVIVSCKKYFHRKINVNSRPFFIIFNHLFGYPKADYELLQW